MSSRFVLAIGTLVLLLHGASETTVPMTPHDHAPVSLDPANLPGYALRTILRMMAAIVFSLVFTFLYGALAAKSRRAEMVLISVLDILQSVPILGFLTFTVVFFMGLFPGRVLGAELAAVFAIFTSQAWNMTFSFYQSLSNVPRYLEEAARSFHLSGWLRFWRLDVPFSMPGLVWNTMMSMSGRLVLRGRIRGDHLRRYDGHVARHRGPRSAGHQAAGSSRRRLRRVVDAAGHHSLRSVAVSADRCLGRQVPL